MHKLDNSILLNVFQFVILFSAIGFVLHFAWEFAQCTPFFIHIGSPPTVREMIFAAGGDLLMMWAVYLMTAIGYRSFTWFQRTGGLRLTGTIVGLSVLIAVLVELWAIKTGRWTYTEKNPLLPVIGISILPLLQMALINPISMNGAKKIVNRLARARYQEIPKCPIGIEGFDQIT